jgi:hypothetical protein
LELAVTQANDGGTGVARNDSRDLPCMDTPRAEKVAPRVFLRQNRRVRTEAGRADPMKRHYTKPVLRKLGLLRSLTRFSF